MTEPIYGSVHSGGVGLGSGSGAGLGLILGAGGGGGSGGGAGEGGGGRPPRPDNWKNLTKLKKKNWRRRSGKPGWGESSAEVLSPLGVPLWELPVGAGIHQLNPRAPSGV